MRLRRISLMPLARFCTVLFALISSVAMSAASTVTSGGISHTLTAPSITTVNRGGILGPVTSTMTNSSSSSYSMYFLVTFNTPKGSGVNTIYWPVTLSAGQTASKNDIAISIPSLADTGAYQFCEYLYDTSFNEIDHKCISFSVAASGGGSSNNASLNGKYYIAALDDSGGLSGAFGYITLDGNGNFANVMTGSSSAGANQSENGTGTYSVNSDGTFTTTSSGSTIMQWGMSADTNTLIGAEVNDTNEQQFAILIKGGTSGYSNSGLGGTYYGVTYGSSHGSESYFSKLTFDGNGNWSVTGTGSSSAGANQPMTASGTYSVNSDGTITSNQKTINNGPDGTTTQCGMSADSNTIVCSVVDDTSFQSITIFIKNGTSGYSDASLNGKYYITEFSNYGNLFGSVTFDGNGNWTMTGTESSSAGAGQVMAASGTYSVNSDGTLTGIQSDGTTSKCGISADAKTIVCSVVDDASNQNISTMIKAAN